MIQRLHVRIYLTTLASLAVVVILTMLLWRFTAERMVDAEYDHFIATVVGTALPPDATPQAMQAALAHMVVWPIEGLALYDSDGRRIAGAGVLARSDGVVGQGWHAHVNSTSRRIHLDDGRIVVARMYSNQLHYHVGGLVLIVLIAFAVGLGTWPVVRRMTRRLEALTVAVDRFGQGDLAVRATTTGRDEVSSLATSFNAMADRVAALLDAHGRMLANASHELRSPLARIRMALELQATDPRPEWLQGMRKDCEEIDAQIEEILLASKLDTVYARGGAEPQLADVDLEVLLAEECARVGIRFDTVAAEVRGDARLLRRMIRNLLENALKHGGKDVEATLAIDAPGARILHVADRGPGIPEAERERIFEPFYRPDRSAETGSGWGLGLALVRQIADLHHGRVRCLPRDGGGAVFEVQLPSPDGGA
ncbi:MAG TPA: HAMP domain-containing sensor histidine kinase [Xanthomonadaceae bacterium]